MPSFTHQAQTATYKSTQIYPGMYLVIYMDSHPPESNLGEQKYRSDNRTIKEGINCTAVGEPAVPAPSRGQWF